MLKNDTQVKTSSVFCYVSIYFIRASDIISKQYAEHCQFAPKRTQMLMLMLKTMQPHMTSSV